MQIQHRLCDCSGVLKFIGKLPSGVQTRSAARMGPGQAPAGAPRSLSRRSSVVVKFRRALSIRRAPASCQPRPLASWLVLDRLLLLLQVWNLIRLLSPPQFLEPRRHHC